LGACPDDGAVVVVLANRFVDDIGVITGHTGERSAIRLTTMKQELTANLRALRPRRQQSLTRSITRTTQGPDEAKPPARYPAIGIWAEQEVPFCSVSGRVRYHPGSGDLRYLVFGLFWCQGLSKPATQRVRTVVRSPASIPRR
jgi:hypothetical protein